MRRTPNIWIPTVLALFIALGLSFVLPKDEERYMRDRFWIHKTFAPAKYDVVIMGDSRVYRGVSPDVMEKKLKNFKILNFGYSNGGLNPEMYKAAEEKLGKSDRPKIIVLSISANAITGFSRDNTQYRQERTLSREEKIEGLYLNNISYWFSPTSPQKLLDTLNGKKENKYYRNHYNMNGYVASEKFPVDTTEAISSYVDDFNHYKVDEKYLQELYSQVKSWTSRGIKVVGFRPPVSLPMRQLEDSLGRYNENEIMTGFEQAGGYWLNLNPNQYKTYDGSHLTIESAKKLSAVLADKIETLIK